MSESHAPFPVRLYTKRVAEQFFKRVIANPNRVRELCVVSPWISEFDIQGYDFERILRAINISRINTYIITRKPEQPWHREAMQQWATLEQTDITFYEDLHAKFYVASGDLHPYALVGSPNLTNRSLDNFELGVMIEGRGGAEGIVQELITQAKHRLRVAPHACSIKRIGGVSRGF